MNLFDGIRGCFSPSCEEPRLPTPHDPFCHKGANWGVSWTSSFILFAIFIILLASNLFLELLPPAVDHPSSPVFSRDEVGPARPRSCRPFGGRIAGRESSCCLASSFSSWASLWIWSIVFGMFSARLGTHLFWKLKTVSSNINSNVKTQMRLYWAA